MELETVDVEFPLAEAKATGVPPEPPGEAAETTTFRGGGLVRP